MTTKLSSDFAILAIVIIVLAIAGTFTEVVSVGARFSFGLASFLACGLVISTHALGVEMSRPQKVIALHFTLLIIVYINSSVVAGDLAGGGYKILQLLTVVGVIIFYSNTSVSLNIKKYITALGYITLGLSMLSSLMWVVSGFPNQYSFLFHNSNVFSQFSICVMSGAFLSLAYTKKNLSRGAFSAAVVFSTVMIFASSSRGAIVAAVIIIAVYFAGVYISRRSWIQHSIYLSVTLLLPFLIAVLMMGNVPVAANIESVFAQISGKEGSLFSARDVIWAEVLDEIRQNPITGIGPSATPASITDFTLSTHNLYLQMGLQAGIAVVCIVLSLMWYMWIYLIRCAGHSNVAKISASFVLAFLVHDIFEITLLQNNLPFGICKWIVMSLGIGVACKYNKYHGKYK